MKVWPSIVAALFALIATSTAEERGTKFFVQLIEGSNDKKPPTSEAKPIGPKLSRKLSQVFQWEYYWEVERKEVTVGANPVKKVKLDAERSLEIQAVDEKNVELRLYRAKELVRKSRHASDQGMMAILGGTKAPDKAWFAVVRRDRPKSANGQ